MRSYERKQENIFWRIERIYDQHLEELLKQWRFLQPWDLFPSGYQREDSLSRNLWRTAKRIWKYLSSKRWWQFMRFQHYFSREKSISLLIFLFVPQFFQYFLDIFLTNSWMLSQDLVSLSKYNTTSQRNTFHSFSSFCF